MKIFKSLLAFAGLAAMGQQEILDQDNEVKSLLSNRVSGYKIPLTKKQQKARNKNKRAAKVRNKY